MNKYFYVLVLFIIMAGLFSCKQKGEVNTELQDAEKETTDLFDDLLAGEETTSAVADMSTETTEEANEEELESLETEDQKVSYAAPSCGDTICTYYETYSSCPDDCERLSKTTLYNYPDFLNNPILLVGDNASSIDVITATVISTYLVSRGIPPTTKLASEVSDFYSQDLILIGNPCENQAITQLLHYDSETCDDVITEMNTAVIKLLVFGTNEIIIITGYDNGDTRDASKMLTTDGTYNLNGAEEWINLDNDGNINIYFSKN